jgi:ubiquinone/menaquinone biosynthesis C-methylase UbiE
MYPLIAEQILSRTKIRSGTCLDAGAGPAPLAIALVMKSDLSVITLDSSPRMQSLIVKNIRAFCLEEKIQPVLGDIHAIPVSDRVYDLVVSRGSYHTWRNMPLALKEVKRVLKPGGMAYIGGGYGSSAIREDVLAARKFRVMEKSLEYSLKPSFQKVSVRAIESAIMEVQFSKYQIIDDDSGLWMLLYK